MKRQMNRPFKIAAGGVALAVLAAGLTALTSTSVASAATPQQIAACPWLDTSKTPDQRAQLLLDASTLQQKYRWLNEQAANSPATLTFSGVTYPAQVACTPTVVYTDGPDGIRGVSGVTAFPSEIGLAATWNADLSYDKGAAQGAEAFDKGKNGVLGPGISSSRTPLAGRTPEYLGEDSLLSGTLAAAVTNGLQTGNPTKPTLTSIKHYVANEQEVVRQTSSSNIDDRTLHEVYDLPFGIVEEKSDPASTMCSYNQINGTFACENSLLNTNLKGELGFTGYVVSDFGAVHSTAPSLNAGLDQELNRPRFYTPALIDAAIAAGTVTTATINKAALNVVRAYIAVGLFDHPLPTTPVADASTPQHKAISQTIAEQGSVLLKNQANALPLTVTSGQKIALVGPTASSTVTGGVSAKSVCSMGAVGRANTMTCEDVVSPETAITARAAQVGATVTFSDGTDVAAAAAASAAADVTIVFGYQRMGEFSDVSDLHLQNGGDALISAVAATAKKTIVVLETGSAVEMPWLNSVNSVVEAWYPGDEQGPALARLLFGDTNFTGKLPMTFPKSIADIPTSTPAQYPGILPAGSTITQVNYSEALKVGYKWYDAQNIEPLFPFGYGLSYTSFDYSGLTASTVHNANGSVSSTVSFTVKNSGTVAGSEIPQVYLTLPGSAGEPGKRLVGFDRVSLQAGKSTTVSVTVDSDTAAHPFGVWDTASKSWKNVDGRYTLSVGSSSRALPLTTTQDVEFSNTAPVAGFTANPVAPNGNAGWYTSPVTVTPTATDNVDAAPVVEVNVDGAGWVTSAAPVIISTDGTHNVQIRATDAAGAVSAVTSWTGKLDLTKPAATASANRDSGTIALSATDATSGVARIEFAPVGTAASDSARWTPYTAQIPVGATTTKLLYRAVDVAGNVGDATQFDYAADSPTVTIAVSDPSVVFGTKVVVTATVGSSAPGSVEFFDGGRSLGVAAIGASTASITVSSLAAGKHQLTAKYLGSGGHNAVTSGAVAVSVAKAATPKVTISGSAYKKGAKPVVKVVVAKLNNGTYGVGKVQIFVRKGSAVNTKTVKLTAADKGKLTVKLAKTTAAKVTVRAVFKPSDSKNVSSKSSVSSTIRRK